METTPRVSNKDMNARRGCLGSEVHPSLHGFIEELKALDDGTQRILDNEDDEREGSSEKEPESRVLRVRKERVTAVVYSYAFTTVIVLGVNLILFACCFIVSGG